MCFRNNLFVFEKLLLCFYPKAVITTLINCCIDAVFSAELFIVRPQSQQYTLLLQEEGYKSLSVRR